MVGEGETGSELPVNPGWTRARLRTEIAHRVPSASARIPTNGPYRFNSPCSALVRMAPTIGVAGRHRLGHSTPRSAAAVPVEDLVSATSMPGGARTRRQPDGAV